jgi:LacI family transcriptional regulator, fructose operon transcriptional repressor
LLDFLPLPVNAMGQQHPLIARDSPATWPWRPLKNNTTRRAFMPLRRTFKQRIHQA